MTAKKLSLIATAIIFSALFATPSTAHAYIDPGSGSMILQLLLAGVAGAAMACKLYWRRFMGIFRRSPKATDSNETK